MESAIAQDQATAEAFATSWNNLPSGSVYTEEQVREWFFPLEPSQVKGRRVLELGCGNASLLSHVATWGPKFIEGVDLGPSVLSARSNMTKLGIQNWLITQGDLTKHVSEGFDLVYCIGVLHHLKRPEEGFRSVLNNVTPGGSFHCWVYAHEGNAVIRWIVDPIRRIVSRFPWWVTKYAVALPLSLPYFLYAKIISATASGSITDKLPLAQYSRWIARRGFRFFWHVAFDQLVTPQTAYIRKSTVEQWLNSDGRIDRESTYIIFRNGNSWKFGGKVKGA